MIRSILLTFLGAFISFNNLIAKEKPNIALLYIDDWAWNGTPVLMNESMANSHMPILQMPNVEKLASKPCTLYEREKAGRGPSES